MFPNRLKEGDIIGLASPSHIASREQYAPIIAVLEAMGFRVKTASNLYAHGWGYAATDCERADDLNELIADDSVKMIFFGGGEGANDMLTRIDYASAARHPKIWLSYSDGTSILNAIHSRTGLPVYYGQMPGIIPQMSEYNRRQFESHLIQGNVCEHEKATPWHTLTEGVGSGELIGGYLDNFIYLNLCGIITPESGKKYVLFIEDHEKFCTMDRESDLLGRLERLPIMQQTTALLFGHYSAPVNPLLHQRLKLLGERAGIPVVYCDDFGHGEYHAILPIGAQATLDANAQRLLYHD